MEIPKKIAPKEKIKIISSKILPDGTNIEMIYDKKNVTSLLVLYKDDDFKIRTSFTYDNIIYKPHAADKDMLLNDVILFPSEPKQYGTEKQLIAKIQKFIHKYLSVSSFFEKISTYYVLFSWVYDDFRELPYLRGLGDYGTGKSRFLKVVGSICYKPIFTSGASTVSPIFRIMNEFHGTLIIDEADFRFSDTTTEIVKILNSGFMKGTPVLRSIRDSKNSFDTKSFDVFCPKLIATRESYQDKALESRMITENMDLNYIRDDIPYNLPDSFEEEALEIRNQLLMFRFHKKGNVTLKTNLENRNIEPRLNQIAIPLMSIISDADVIKDMQQYIINYNEHIKSDRTSGKNYQLLKIICNLIDDGHIEPTIGLVATVYNKKLDTPNEQLTAKKIGYLIGTGGLRLLTRKTRNGYVISQNNSKSITILRKRYGIKNVNVVNNVNIKNKQSTTQIPDKHT